MNEIVRQQDSLIYAKQSRIDILTWQRDTFVNQLENAELEKIELEKKLKKAQQNVKNYSIAAFLLGAITTILLLY